MKGQYGDQDGWTNDVQCADWLTLSDVSHTQNGRPGVPSHGSNIFVTILNGNTEWCGILWQSRGFHFECLRRPCVAFVIIFDYTFLLFFFLSRKCWPPFVICRFGRRGKRNRKKKYLWQRNRLRNVEVRSAVGEGRRVVITPQEG